MKLTIKGDVNLPVLGEAVTKAWRLAGYDPERFVIRGATVYMNFYDRETGDQVAFTTEDGDAIENVLYQTPQEIERQRQMALARKSKTKRLKA